MINWRQLYNESQAIQPDDTNVPTERICRLVNIYKNDMIEQDLHRYASRLSKFSRSCQICTPKSYTMYKWLDTHISGEKNLFDFRLSGRSVSAFVYYWNKRLFEENNKRGQLSDFKRGNDGRKSMISVTNLSNIDENIFIKKQFFIPIISHLLTRFQMYYTYRKARSVCSSIQVHIHPMKTFRHLFQTNICPIFVCFINEDNHLHQLFWIFRHLITIFNWPLTTKIFSNRSLETKSIFERLMINSLGFIDLSVLNLTSIDLFSYLYRCLKTCQENGPMIFLFDYSTIFKPKSSDYLLMSFLCDLTRFDLSIPDLVIIPTCLYKSNLTFSQPFLFKELVDSFVKKFSIENQLCQLIQTEEEQKIVYQFSDCIFRHLGYDVNQLITTRLEFQHIIAAIELCQINPPSTVEIIYSTLQNLLKTCSFIIADNHQWNEITEEDIFKFKNMHSKSKLISVIRKEYFLDILIALTILSKTEHHGNISRLFEYEMFNQLRFLLFTFDHKQYLNLRPCQNLHHIIQHCQMRNYISPDYIPQKSMTFRDTILSDHEWSDDDDDDGLEDEFLDHSDNDDEILTNNLSNKIPETVKPFYRINYQENLFQLKFFARLFGSLIEAIVLVLKYHIDKQLKFFTIDEFDNLISNRNISFSGETSHDILSIIRRAYAYRLLEHPDIFNENSTSLEIIDEEIYPLSIEKLVSLHDEFMKLLNCLI